MNRSPLDADTNRGSTLTFDTTKTPQTTFGDGQLKPLTPQAILQWRSPTGARPITVYVSAIRNPIPGGPPLDTNTLPAARITWGNGGAQFVETIDATAPRAKFACVAERIDIDAFPTNINTAVGQTLIGPQTIVYTATVGSGSDPEFKTNLNRVVSQGLQVSGVILPAAGRVRDIFTWDASAAAGSQSLMLFDVPAGTTAASLAGRRPVLELPIETFPALTNADFEDSPEIFRNGCLWFVSSTRDTLTLSVDGVYVFARTLA